MQIVLVHCSSPELILHSLLWCQDISDIGDSNKHPVGKAKSVDETRFDHPWVNNCNRDSWVAPSYLTTIEGVRKFALSIAELASHEGKVLLRLKVFEDYATGRSVTHAE